MGSLIDTARMEYEKLGFDTIPLIPGSKKPFAYGWQNRPVNRLWKDAPQDSNIGIRGGGLASIAIIDCDKPQTFEYMANWLAGIGYQPGDYPVVQTASGTGRHIYTTFGGNLSGEWRILKRVIGKGEFRYGAGSQVAAPPSAIMNGGAYILISGDFARLPSLALNDVLPLLENQELKPNGKSELKIPRRAMTLLKGDNDKEYASRSHFDGSLIASLINAGHSFESVLKLFEIHPTSGKYDEIKKTKGAKSALHYLKKSYESAEQWTKSHDGKARRSAQAAIEWAESTPWPGRTGAVDRLIFIAHMNIAYKAGRLIWAADCRSLAEQAGISYVTASNSTKRLCNFGFLILEKKAVADSANIFKLGNSDELLHSPSSLIVRKCKTLSANHDIFRFGGLGKSAGEIWQALQEKPATLAELAGQTGRHVKTVKRVLVRMAKLADPLTGEILPMVASDDSGETYHALSVDLDRIAHAIGTAGAGQRQKELHIKERRLHARSLWIGKKTKRDDSQSGDNEKV